MKDSPEVRQVMANPDDYVMKPQRNGGGNNFFGSAIADAIASLPQWELSMYTIQAFIRSQPRPTWVVTPRSSVEPRLINGIPELGVFGAFLRDRTKEEPLLNVAAGHLVRTKDVGNMGGGVCCGAAVLDSPLLE
eukprot:TRINITY_DN6123_c0_g2_i4.p1 TRINITY_DN6123_c0_g2~~TRINITY_DN6123_c0_g2_i4.p1  ORF type:complete len:134 (-),score=35.07 TRINITY_DN6123_c0_g2_i4:155-556(-)